jgi:hypothetical protein
MITAGLSKTFTVKCSYDSRLVDSIIVYGSSGESYACALTGDSKAFVGYSFAEVKYVLKQKRKVDKGEADNTLQEKIKLKQHMRRLSEPAVAAAQVASKGIAKSARRVDAAPARNAEKTLRRRAEVVMPEASASADKPNNIITLTPRRNIEDRSPDIDKAQPDTTSIIQTIPTAQGKLSIAEYLRRKAKEKTNELINH